MRIKDGDKVIVSASPVNNDNEVLVNGLPFITDMNKHIGNTYTASISKYHDDKQMFYLIDEHGGQIECLWSEEWLTALELPLPFDKQAGLRARLSIDPLLD